MCMSVPFLRAGVRVMTRWLFYRALLQKRCAYLHMSSLLLYITSHEYVCLITSHEFVCVITSHECVCVITSHEYVCAITSHEYVCVITSHEYVCVITTHYDYWVCVCVLWIMYVCVPLFRVRIRVMARALWKSKVADLCVCETHTRTHALSHAYACAMNRLYLYYESCVNHREHDP